MKKKFKLQSRIKFRTRFKVFVLIFSLFFSLFTLSDAKIYIDITSPALRKLPISFNFAGEKADEIAGVIKDDLEFTGIFYPVEPNIAGAEITVKIDVKASVERLSAEVLLTDLIEDKEILRKRYEAEKDILRTLAHTISNDIFKVITGQAGVFRTRIAYLMETGGKKGLHLMDWDGYNAQMVVSKGLTFGHSWSRDGEYLLYSSERDRSWSIYSMNLKDNTETMLFSSKGLNLVGGTSPQGYVAFSSSKDGSPEIYIMGIDGSNPRRLTRTIGIDVSPIFSPSGQEIAFVSDRGGSPQIYIMDINGSGIRRITFEGNYNTSPVWSPDGKWMAYSGRKDGNNQIFIVNLETMEARQLTENGNNESPTFSPDGMFIAFDSDRDGVKGIYIMRINGDGQKRITPKGVKAMVPRWSPYLK